MQDIEAIGAVIAEPQTVLITTHQNPDADAMGSSLGLAGYLRKKGHRVTVVTPTDYGQNLYWLSGNEEVIAFDEKVRVTVNQLFDEADVIFCLDFSSLDRIRDLAPLVRQSRARKVLIDHHLEPESFAELALWDPTAAATAELVFRLIVALGDKALIDVPIAECLYSGLMTDTGSFRHSNTTGDVHRMAAELVDLKIDVSSIHRRIFDNVSIDKFRLLGYVLNEKLNVLPEYRFAYITLTDAELKQYRSKTGDTEGMVNYALSVEGVVMAAILIDRVDEIRISFRSIGDFSVRELSNKHFNGGGHRNAAGGRSKLSLAETEQKLLAILPEYKELLFKTV
ncbi:MULTISPECIES: DHH family phosphoesterase [Spirosoma]|uniref:Bifunctional oligoribonuclease/PAP phosphatase NrnA n=1 Tax=Spirosoma liriopis TaxID=2937440 RepID=A0ABT0HHM9_9BACT|nr:MULTISPECIES: bifunctional oligoribonuclease/PAP phosphatase NrnA [Spirosoma]MCK8491669.1 bifunctional oligoribonuclease/PAP phosphatase NrnA [Spirosoma liriopis]UHG91031.1 bifunctional oligoribonuclease/PAP phosphatase NrnA [Spirosoma oryzicola]